MHLITKIVTYFQTILPEYKCQIKNLSTDQCALNKLTQFYSKTHSSPHIFAFHHFITNAIMFIACALVQILFLFPFSTNDQITSGEVAWHVTRQIDILPPFLRYLNLNHPELFLSVNGNYLIGDSCDNLSPPPSTPGPWDCMNGITL